MDCRLFGAKPFLSIGSLKNILVKYETNRTHIQEIACENVVWKMSTTMSRPWCINGLHRNSSSMYTVSQCGRCMGCAKLKKYWAYQNDVIMRAMASQITSLIIVYSIVYSGTDQRKHQSSASLAFVRGIHRWPVNSPHKWPITRKMLPFDDVIMMIRIQVEDKISSTTLHNQRSTNCKVSVFSWIKLERQRTWWILQLL